MLLSVVATAQPLLTKEINTTVEPLVKELNRFEGVKTVAIATFTYEQYVEIPKAGQFLAEEFMTSFVQYRGKNFQMINRGQLKSLMDELKLDRKGALAPDNIPRLGRLKSVDVIISATVAVFTNNLRLNVQAVRLETGAVITGCRGMITLTPSLRKMLKQDDMEARKKGGSARGQAVSFQHQNITINLKECKRLNGNIRCTLQAESRDITTHLSFYPKRSTVVIDGQEVYISRASLGPDSGRGRVTSTLYADEPTDMTVDFPVSNHPSLTRLSLSFYSADDGSFSANFENITVN